MSGNRLTHSVWAGGDVRGTAARLKVTARESRGFRFESEIYDESRLAGFVGSIKQLSAELLLFSVDLAARGRIGQPSTDQSA